MTPDEFGSALAEFAPDDTKVVVTITSDCVVFSAIPRVYSKASLPTREFPVKAGVDLPDDAMAFARLELFPEEVKRLAKIKQEIEAKHRAEFDAKQAELTKAEEDGKERVAQKITGAKPEFASRREEKRVTEQRAKRDTRR